MTKRRGASLLNVMVFVLFAMMIAAQVFFFSKASLDSVSEEREIMMYRMNLDTLVEEAKLAVKNMGSVDTLPRTASYANFYDMTDITNTVWTYPGGVPDPYHASIHNLNYELSTAYDRATFISQSRDQRIFAAMSPLSYDKIVLSSDGVTQILSTDGVTPITEHVITNSFYLIRAWATLPENYYGVRLMYQVLVSKDERSNTTEPDILSFQEVWY